MNRGVLARQMFAAGGEALKPIPAGNAGLPNLPKSVRNNMGYMQDGGAVGMQQAGGEPQMSLQDYLGDQAAPLAAEARRLGISVEQLLAMLNQQPAPRAMPQQPVGMAMGGDPAMAQGLGSMMAAPPAMPPAQPPMEDAQAMDPQVLEGMLNEASQSVGDLDEAEDYETVINSIRGDDAPISARYEELASVVGEQDAAQTPESVLALTQPAIMMGAVDQGIGGLAAEEMTQPVEGAMAQGIMSTMAPSPPPAAPPMDPAMMGGPPPVNFNQGGLVRRGDNQPVQMYANGGEPGKFFPYALADSTFTAGSNSPMLDSRTLQNIAALQNQSAAAQLPKPELSYEERVLAAAKGAEARYATAGLGTAEERAAGLEEQRKLTKANMLFDIANTALAFAAPMQGETPGMSAAERLAMAARTTQLPQTIAARAQSQRDAEQASKKEERALKLAAVQRGESQVDTEIASEQALALARAKPKTVKPMKLVVGGKEVFFDGSSSVTYDTYAARAAKEGGQIYDVGTEPKPSETKTDRVRIMVDGREINVVDLNTKEGQQALIKARSDNTGKKVETVTISAAPAQSDKKIGLYEIRDKETGKIIKSGIDVYSTSGYNQIKTLPANQIANKVGEYKQGSTLAAKPIEVRDKNGDIIQRLDLSLPADRTSFASLGTDVTTHTISAYTKDAKSSVWKEIRSSDGTLVDIVDTNTETGAAAVKKAAASNQGAFNIGTYSAEKPETGSKGVRTTAPVTIGSVTIPAGTAVLLGNQQIADVLKAQPGAFEPVAEKDRNKPVEMFGSGSAGKALKYFVTTKVPDTDILALDAYADGADDPILEAQFAAFTKVTTDQAGKAQKNALPPFVIDKIKKRVLAGGNSPVPLNTLGLTRDESARLLPSQDVPLINPDTNKVNIERALADGTFIIDVGADLTQATGFTSTVDRVANTLMGQFGKLGIGPGYAGTEARLTTSADVQLNELARRTIATFRPDTRIFKLDVEGLKSLVKGFEPGGLTTDQGALAALKKTRDSLALNYSNAIDDLQMHDEVAGSLSPENYGIARTAERDLRQLIAEYTAAIVAFETNMRPGGAAGAVSTSSNRGPTVTSTLPRVSTGAGLSIAP